MKKTLFKKIVSAVLCFSLLFSTACIEAFAKEVPSLNVQDMSSADIINSINVYGSFSVRPGYNAFQGNITVECPYAQSITINKDIKNATEATSYIDGYNLNEVSTVSFNITVQTEFGSYSGSKTISVYDYMGSVSGKGKQVPVSFTQDMTSIDISSYVEAVAAFDVRPSYNAYQGKVEIKCGIANSIKIDDTLYNGSAATHGINGNLAESNPRNVNITIYTDYGIFSTSCTLNVYDYMGYGKAIPLQW